MLKLIAKNKYSTAIFTAYLRGPAVVEAQQGVAAWALRAVTTPQGNFSWHGNPTQLVPSTLIMTVIIIFINHQCLYNQMFLLCAWGNKRVGCWLWFQWRNTGITVSHNIDNLMHIIINSLIYSNQTDVRYPYMRLDTVNVDESHFKCTLF